MKLDRILAERVSKFFKDNEDYFDKGDFSDFTNHFIPYQTSIYYSVILEMLEEIDVYPFNLLVNSRIKSTVGNIVDNFIRYPGLKGTFVNFLNDNEIDFFKALNCKIYELKRGIKSLNHYIILRKDPGSQEYEPLQDFLDAHGNILLVGSQDAKDWEEI